MKTRSCLGGRNAFINLKAHALLWKMASTNVKCTKFVDCGLKLAKKTKKEEKPSGP